MTSRIWTSRTSDADAEKRRSNRAYVDRLFSLKRFLAISDLRFMMSAEWTLTAQAFSLSGVWLNCPACDGTSFFYKADISFAFARPSTRPFLKCELCTFQPYLPDNFDALAKAVTVLLKPDGLEESEGWLEIDGDSANQENHPVSPQQGLPRREDSRRLFPVKRPT